jgi:hypothetical protein
MPLTIANESAERQNGTAWEGPGLGCEDDVCWNQWSRTTSEEPAERRAPCVFDTLAGAS